MKKTIPLFALFLVLGLLLNTAIPCFAQGEEAAAEPLPITVLYRNTPVREVLDGDITTAKGFMPNELVSITAEEDICALYIQWEKDPGPWTLLCGGEELAAGQYGFRHEYIALPAPCRELQLRTPDGEASWIAELCALSAGALPEGMQDWAPPCEQADLLVFPTHSDDEFVFLGGVIPFYVDRGMTVQAAYVVRHNGYRYHEMLDSLWEAGVRNYPVTSTCADIYCKTVDQAIQTYGEKYMTSYMVEQIRRFKPLVVVGQAENGESGHPVHVFGVMCLKAAVERSGDAAYAPASAEAFGVWDVPKTYLHLYGEEERMVTLDYDRPLGRFGGATAFEVADRAFERCVSQFNGGKYEVYRADSPYDPSRLGLFRSLVGEDQALDDLFENIDADAWHAAA